MAYLGLFVIGVGAIISLFFSIQILIKNFQENVLWGIGSLFFGLPMLIYVAMRWDQVGSLFLKSLAASLGSMALGSVLMALGG